MVYSTFDIISRHFALRHAAEAGLPKQGQAGELSRKSGYRQVLLALAFFLFAQFGAQFHTYAHDAAGLGSSHQTIAVSHGPCDECLAYAPLLSATASPARMPRLPGAPRLFAPVPRFVSLVDRAPILAFRSRAPPEATPA